MPDTVGVPLIVIVFAAQLPVTPAGKPVIVAPVAPVVAYVTVVIGVFIQSVWLSVPGAEVRVIVLFGVTVIVTLPHPADQQPLPAEL